MFCQFSMCSFFSFWSLFCPSIRWYLSWVNYFQLLKFYFLKNWYSCVLKFGFPVFQASPLICKMLLRFLRHSETLKWFLKALSIYYIAASFSRLDCLIRQLTLQHYLIDVPNLLEAYLLYRRQANKYTYMSTHRSGETYANEKT